MGAPADAAGAIGALPGIGAGIWAVAACGGGIGGTTGSGGAA